MSVPDQEAHVSLDQTHRLCDFCNESKALLYCRADSAKLCLNCDGEVHSTNQLFKKHVRYLLCDSCNSSSSSIICCTESTVLCQNCDWKAHKKSGSSHNRRPIQGFKGCPSVIELLNFVGLDDLGEKSSSLGSGQDDDEFLDYLVWETPSSLNIDDLIVVNDCIDTGPGFQSLPPLPKNRNEVCGKQKEEIVCQLREMANKDPNFGSIDDLHVVLQSQVPRQLPFMDNNSGGGENNLDPVLVPSHEVNTPDWSFCNGEVPDESVPSEMNHLVPDKDSDLGENTSFVNPFKGILPHARELNTEKRETAISRYKEKRKTRRYDKHVRYESRKARAETRSRINGRFAKIDKCDDGSK